MKVNYISYLFTAFVCYFIAAIFKPFDLRPSPNKNIDSSQCTAGILLFYCWTSGILSLKPYCRSSGLLRAAFNVLYWLSLRSTQASITLLTSSINMEQSAAQRRRELCLPHWRGETCGEVWGRTTHALPNRTWCLYVRSQLRPRHHWVRVRDGQTDWWCRDQRRLCCNTHWLNETLHTVQVVLKAARTRGKNQMTSCFLCLSYHQCGQTDTLSLLLKEHEPSENIMSQFRDCSNKQWIGLLPSTGRAEVFSLVVTERQKSIKSYVWIIQTWFNVL